MNIEKIVCVEDDPELAENIVDFLAPKGFDVICEPDGEKAIPLILDEAPDVVLLDIGLPGIDGFEVCKRIRKDFKGAILFLTARDDDFDEVIALEIGADDFLLKPVRPQVLVARIRSHIRKKNPSSENPEKTKLQVDQLTINSLSRTCSLDGTAIDLSTAEFDLVWLLAQNAGRIVTRNELYLELLGYKYDGLDRSIDLRVSRLRRKLEEDPDNPKLVKSVRGVGYMLAMNC